MPRGKNTSEGILQVRPLAHQTGAEVFDLAVEEVVRQRAGHGARQVEQGGGVRIRHGSPGKPGAESRQHGIVLMNGLLDDNGRIGRQHP